MKLRRTVFALAVLAGTSCSATVDGTTVRVGDPAPVNDRCNDFNELAETINVDEHIADPGELEQLGEALSTCMSLEEAVDIPHSFMVNNQPQPESTRDCYQPFVEANRTSFIIAGHNQAFDQPTQPPHRDRWVEALSNCLPASYLVSPFIAPAYRESQHLTCYDMVYRPVHLEPLIGAFTDAIPTADLPENSLHQTFDPMYQCAAFMEGEYGSEFFATLDDDGAACLESLAPRFLLFQTASDPLGTSDEFNTSLAECLSSDELARLQELTSSG